MSLITSLVGWFFFVAAAVQWFAPEYHTLSYVLRRSAESGGIGERDAEQSSRVLVRVFAFCAMVVSGFFLMIAWTGPVLMRLYAIGVQLLPGASLG